MQLPIQSSTVRFKAKKEMALESWIFVKKWMSKVRLWRGVWTTILSWKYLFRLESWCIFYFEDFNRSEIRNLWSFEAPIQQALYFSTLRRFLFVSRTGNSNLAKSPMWILMYQNENSRTICYTCKVLTNHWFFLIVSLSIYEKWSF